MSASSEIRFKIGADTSAFSRGMAQAQSVAAVAGKQIEKKLGLKDAFKSGVLALGLDIKDLSTKFAELFTGGKQDDWIKGMEAAAEITGLILEKQLSHLDATRQIATLEKEIARNKEDENPAVKTQSVTTPTRIDPFTGRKTGGEKIDQPLETEAEAFKRSQEAIKRGLLLEKQVETIKKSSGNIDKRIADAKKHANDASLNDEEKLAALRAEAADMEKEIGAAKVKTDEVKQRELDLAAKTAEINALDKKIIDDKNRAYDEQAKKVAELNQQLDHAGTRAIDAVNKLSDARHDFLAPSLAEVAKGGRGTGILHSDSARARAIQRDEDTARRLALSGNTVSQFFPGEDTVTPSGRHVRGPGFNRQVGAEFFRDRAEQARAGFDKIKSDDQRPFEAATQELRDANRHLEEIQQSLKAVDVKS